MGFEILNPFLLSGDILQKKAVRSLVIGRLKEHPRYNAWPLYTILFNTEVWRQAHQVAITLSTSLELNTQPVIKQAVHDHKLIRIPKTFPGRKMAFFPFNSTTPLKKDRWGIWEPSHEAPVVESRIDLMVVPGLAFARDGSRLGFGGGYYDRYLKKYSGKTIALVSPMQWFNQPLWPVSPYDVKLQYLITEQGFFKC